MMNAKIQTFRCYNNCDTCCNWGHRILVKWIDGFSFITHIGHIIFSEDGQFVTFTSTDTGSADGEGNFMYKGAIIFDSAEPVGIFSKLDNQIGLYITWSGNNGTNWSKTWLWE
jgi:hypothetical protein